MTIVIHDLGDLELYSAEEKAETIVDALHRNRQYDPDYLYRGLMATPNKIKRIILSGTDKTNASGKVDIDQHAVRAAGQVAAQEAAQLESLMKGNNGIFAAREDELADIIGAYATDYDESPKSASPLVLVYRADCLDMLSHDFFTFKEGTRPIDALVTGFRFDE